MSANRRIPVTEDKLRAYIKACRVIEVIPLKDEPPIFVLKYFNRSESKIKTLAPLEIADIASIDNPGEIIIHKEHFILPSGYKIVRPEKFMIGVAPREVRYIDKYERVLTKKEFLVKTILDEKIQLQIKKSKKDKKGRKSNKSKMGYLKLIRDFLRKYKIMGESRGRGFIELIKERNQIIVKKYKELIKEARWTTKAAIKEIKKWLQEYAETIKYSDRPKEAERINKVFNVSDSTIWRTIPKFHKK